MSTNKQRRAAIAQMVVCAILWSTAGILIKLVDWNPFVIAGYRGLFAAVTVGVYMAVTKHKPVVTKDVLISAFFLAATFFCFVASNKMTSAANAIVLQFTSPIFITVFSAVFFRQRYSASDYLTVFLTFCGIAVFFLSGLGQGRTAGNLVGVLAGIFMAGMYLSVGRTDSSQKMSGILFGQVLTAVIGIPFSFFAKWSPSPVDFIYVAVLGIIQIGIPYILLACAIVHCPPLSCSLIGALEPLLNPIWVLIFNGERPDILSAVGGVIVIGAVTAQCILQDKRASRSQGTAAETSGR